MITTLLISNLFPSSSSPEIYPLIKRMTRDDNQFDYIKAVNYDPRRGRMINIIKYSLLFLKVIKSLVKDFDIIEVHYIIPTGFFGLIAKLVRKKPMISVIHGSDLNYLPEKSSFYNWLARKVLSNSDLIVVLSREHKQKLINKYKIEPEKIFLILAGPEINFKQITKFKKVVNLANDFNNKHLALFIGRHFIKRGEDFIKSFKYLNDKKYQGIMIVDDVQERKRLNKILNDQEIKNVKIFPGVQNRILLLIIAISDVLIIPSLSETLCIAGLEALICGRPIIATPVGEIKRFMIHNNNGFIVEKKKPIQIAQAVKKLFNNHKAIQNNVFQQQKKLYRTYNFDQFLIKLNKRRKQLKQTVDFLSN